MHKKQLPNGCYIGKISVYPANWDSKGASLSVTWRIQYRFYDPQRIPAGKLRIVKGMNAYTTLEERRAELRRVMKVELEILEDGYNPITGEQHSTFAYGNIHPNTPFIAALEYVRNEITVCHALKLDMKSQLKYVQQAALLLGISTKPIKELRRRDMREILKKLSTIRPVWNNGRYNKYKTNLSILFKELVEMEVIESNPMKDIAKKGKDKPAEVRETLSRQERRVVDAHLRNKKQTRFRLLMRIFFHSGIRETELMNIRGKDVDLGRQLVECSIMKGKTPAIVYKTIKDIAVRYWRLALAGCGPEDYVFSKGLMPGTVKVNSNQITRRWHRHVKALPENGGLGISADFYSFKHGNTTEMVDTVGNETAAGLNSHKDTAMVRKIYDTKRISREHEKIKKAANEF